MSSDLISKINSRQYKEPVFCFTSDIDWASEEVMLQYFMKVNPYELHPTLFLTHHSSIAEEMFLRKKIDRGIHPNFLKYSSHGDTFGYVIDTCLKFAPEAKCFRSHRAFDVTDTNHLLKEKYKFQYSSNYFNVFGKCFPMYHESGLINFPIFFEDGTHLYNKFDLNFSTYEKFFCQSGLKIISFHPMNFIFNSPSLSFMRNIKDSMSREEFNTIGVDEIANMKNKFQKGIGDFVIEIIEWVKSNDFQVMTLQQLYDDLISEEDCPITEALEKFYK